MKNNTFLPSTIRIAVLACLLSIGMLFTSPVQAATITYSATTGNWTDANWAPQAPVAGDNVVIPAGAIVTLSTDAGIKINSLSVQGTLLISSTGILSVEQTANINPLVNVGGGDIENSGTFSIKQTLPNSNAAITLGNGTDADSRFVNTGVLNIDMMASTIASSSTRCIYLTQTTANRVPRITLGGTMNFTVPTGTRFFELGGGANAVIDGTAVFGSTSDYKNWRLIHIGNGGTLTLAGNIEFFSGYVSANGAISMSVTGTGSAVGTLINSGTLRIHGGSAVTGYALYLNAQRTTTTPYSYGTAILKNTGNIVIDGNFPSSYGAIYLNGNPGTTFATDVFTNDVTGTLSITNTATTPTISFQIANALLSTFTNKGTLTLNTAGNNSVVMGDANSTFTNQGTVTVNKAITGYTSNATAANVYNTSGEFIFSMAANATAIDGTNKITFTNNGGIVSGQGLFGAGKFVPSTGTLSPGGALGTGTFTITDPTLALTGNCVMNVNGITAAGTDYDQIVSTGSLDISGVTLNMNVGYTPANTDQVSLISAVTRTGNFMAVNAPSKWVATYTATTANMLYDTSTGMETKAVFNGVIFTKDQNIIVNLGSDASAQLQVIDMTGRLVKQTTLTSKNNTICATDLKGVYIVRLKKASESFTQKINL